MRSWFILAALTLTVGVVSAQVVDYQPPGLANETPEELKKIDVVEHLGETVPGDITFKDEDGKTVTLNSYLNQNKPVLLNLAYYECPMLCTLVLNGVAEAMKSISLDLGKDYIALAVSIDPSETPDLAKQKREAYIDALGDKRSHGEYWHFLTGNQENIDKLATAIGFKYAYMAESQDYAHPAVTTVLSPEGKVSRYLYGAQYKSSDVQLALLEAGKEHIATSLQKILLYCYRYDPSAKGYVVWAWRLMRLAAFVTMITIMTALGIYFWNEKKNLKNTKDNHSEAA